MVSSIFLLDFLMLNKKQNGKLNNIRVAQKGLSVVYLFKNLKDTNCFSYTGKDVILLLSFYNVTFFFCLGFLNGDPQYSLLIAFLGSLTLMLFITSIHFIDKKHIEEKRMLEEEQNTIKKIRQEYQRIYRLKQKDELLTKIEALNQKMKKNISFDLDTPPEEAFNSDNPHKMLHFSFLDKTNPSNTEENKPQSHPQGS